MMIPHTFLLYSLHYPRFGRVCQGVGEEKSRGTRPNAVSSDCKFYKWRLTFRAASAKIEIRTTPVKKKHLFFANADTIKG